MMEFAIWIDVFCPPKTGEPLGFTSCHVWPFTRTGSFVGYPKIVGLSVVHPRFVAALHCESVFIKKNTNKNLFPT